MDISQALHQMVQDIMSGNASDAQTTFTNVMSHKLNDALETTKSEIAGSLYGQPVETTEVSDDQVN